MFFSHNTYCTGQGLSKPNRSRMDAMVSALIKGLVSIWLKKSPGAKCITKKVRREIPNSTGTKCSSRFKTNRPKR